ncbi:Peptidoglycan/xylan/chitin deacetylase, PgdA/CDA1 family [Flavobacteriaceae bacterium MAR_2010_188]|nr:Peptidoglycan/xylan/chitin deacetylase, PgdA/CDA1 family [Flavobacteriaceae bacterium MAR_2010_188]
MIKHNNVYLISFVILLITIALDFLLGIHLSWYLLPILFLFFAIGYGSFNMSHNFFLKSISNNNGISEKKIAITFDDGPNAEFTPIVLDILKKHQAVATFFCIGKNIENHPELLKRIRDEGHSIGNHSYSHNNRIDFNSTEKWLEEIEKTDRIIEDTIGLDCIFFRPPFGVTTPNLAKAIEKTRHTVIGWNIRTYDTVRQNPKPILKNIGKQLSPGSIILLHDKHPRIPIILEQLLELLREQKYQTVSIKNLLDEA